MRPWTPVIRIFISSTFNDFREERDRLHDIVFPRLKDYCESRGARFQVVDLRWGVREEDAVDHRTMKICLEEIRRCQRLSPKPNFLVLLGNRYGWQPLPAEIPGQEFEQILQYYAERQASTASDLLQHWYLLDENAVPPLYYLRPRSGRYLSYQRWLMEEERIRLILQEAVNVMHFNSSQREKYVLSATGQEIVLGALKTPADVLDSREHVFGFFRNIENASVLKGKTDARFLFDYLANGAPDVVSGRQLGKLKLRLKRHLQDNVRSYQVKWLHGSMNKDYFEGFCNDLYYALFSVIENQLYEQEKNSELERECNAHQNFLAERVALFSGRDELRRKAKDYFHRPKGKPLVLYGPGGCGKSSLLAKIIEECSDEFLPHEVIYRFIGVTPASASAYGLLESLNLQLAQVYEVENHQASAGLDEASEKFLKYLAYSKPEKPLLIVLDGLDQLIRHDETALEFKWLPVKLPPHTAMLLSAAGAEVQKKLRKKYPASSLVKVTALESSVASKILDGWLNDAGRTLQPAQREEVLGAFARESSPLFLKLAFEMAKTWRSGDSKHLPHSLDRLIYRLCLDLQKQYGQVVARQSLNYLTASRYGLSEDELLELLSRDPEVMGEYAGMYPHSPETGGRLPFIAWARIYADLDAYLMERDTDGSILLGFFHRKFIESIKKTFLPLSQQRDCHQKIAAYYLEQKPYWDQKNSIVNLRMISELPHQLMAGNMDQQLSELMSDQSFLQAKIVCGRRFELFDEILQTHERINAQPAMVQPMLRALYELIREAGGPENKLISMEELHSAMVYRDNTAYYEAFLQYGMDQESAGEGPLPMACAVRMANMKRRQGKLDGAEQAYQAIITHLAEMDHKERARFQYDIGYCKYLRGNYQEAIHYLHESAASAGEKLDPVGYWISTCVEYFVRMQEAMATERFERQLDDFDRILDEALQVFTAFEKDSSNAHRWIMNVYAHRFKTAFYRNDFATAHQQASLLEDHAWVKTYGGKDFMLAYRARLNLLGNRPTSRYFQEIYRKNYKGKSLEDFRSMESAVENYYDYGRVLDLTGEPEKARQIWQEGLLFPDEPGNHKWKERIRSRLGANK